MDDVSFNNEDENIGKIDVIIQKKHKEEPIIADEITEVEQVNPDDLPQSSEDASVIFINDSYVTEEIEKIREQNEIEKIMSKQSNVEIIDIDKIIEENNSKTDTNSNSSSKEENKEETNEEEKEEDENKDESLEEDIDDNDDVEEVVDENIYMVGKQEKNLVKKVIKLKKIELKKLIVILISKNAKKVKYKKLIDKAIDNYIELKYINRTNFKAENAREYDAKINEGITSYFKEAIKDYDEQEELMFVKNLCESFYIINRLDNIRIDNISAETLGNSLEFLSVDLVVEMIKKIMHSYRNLYDSYIAKLESKNFFLMSTKLNYENKENIELYGTNLLVRIEFNKIFSDFIIRKSFEEDVIVENLREVQLKMISLRLTEGLMDHTFNKKYLIFFPLSLYDKEKKLRSIFSCINDYYSQSSIIIIINIEIIRTHFKEIVDLRKEGFNFGIEIDSVYINYLIDLKEVMPLAEYVFISGEYKDINEMRHVVPSYLVDRVVYLEKSLFDGVVVE